MLGRASRLRFQWAVQGFWHRWWIEEHWCLSCKSALCWLSVSVCLAGCRASDGQGWWLILLHACLSTPVPGSQANVRGMNERRSGVRTMLIKLKNCLKKSSCPWLTVLTAGHLGSRVLRVGCRQRAMGKEFWKYRELAPNRQMVFWQRAFRAQIRIHTDSSKRLWNYNREDLGQLQKTGQQTQVLWWQPEERSVALLPTLPAPDSGSFMPSRFLRGEFIV